MSEVPSVGEIHPEYLVPGLEHGGVDCKIGL